MENQKYKYPRTFHLPWSLGRTADDKVLSSTDHFIGKRVVVTEKMDGENTTLTKKYTHARSLDSRHHFSRDLLKSYWASIKFDIPDNFRICGEYLYAQHSIVYEELLSYFYGFSVWNKNTALSWNETLEWFNLLNIQPVKTFWTGIYDEKILIELSKKLNLSTTEGYVVRIIEEFEYDDFDVSIAKFVRKEHVKTDKHWMHSEIKCNKLIKR